MHISEHCLNLQHTAERNKTLAAAISKMKRKTRLSRQLTDYTIRLDYK